MRAIFIDIDTLNPGHMGCYGYYRNTTPNIDGIAKDGIVFDDYYCADAPCLPSRTGLVSGMLGIHSGCVGHGGLMAERAVHEQYRLFQNHDDINNLFYQFRKANMYTVSISSFAERHSAWWFNAGCNEVYNTGECGMESGEKVLPIALKWLGDNKERSDWFLHLNIWDPHTPIRVPDSYEKSFDDSPIESWYTEELLQKHLQSVGPHSVQEVQGYTYRENPKYPKQMGGAQNLSELKKVVDSYDLGISYADYIVGQVVNLLKEQGIYDDTMIIVSADHGETIGELGMYQEHGTADYHTCRIPFIMKYPGGAKGIHATELYYQIDLLPTIAELLGNETYARWDGKSYANLVKTGNEDRLRDYLVVSQMAHVCQRGVRFDDYMYIRTYHDGFHLFPQDILFNIKSDPHELDNLADRQPQLLQKAKGLLEKWHSEMLESSSLDFDPMEYVLDNGGPFHAKMDMLFPNYISRLRDTGRAMQADELESKYATLK